jgi:ADP-heptose:LPS heptosyltransferase
LETSIIHQIKKTVKPIKRILVIRLQATGDVMGSLPYLQDLRSKLNQEVELDFMVREEAMSVPVNTTIFNRVYVLKGGRNTKLQFFYFLLMYPKIFLKKYDVLIDLQNHKLTHYIRKLLQIKTYSIFDKVSPLYGGTRYQSTINALKIVEVNYIKLDRFKPFDKIELYKKLNLSSELEYIVINPAGAFENRNWDLDNYVEYCLQWNKKINTQTKFLVLGLASLKHKAEYLKSKLGDVLIDLTGKTEFIEVIHLLRHVKLVLSEDSGLMHAAYIVGTPTIGILGSTRNDWTNPKLAHTYFYSSTDLPCGDCMLFKCKFDEIKCLVRIKPDEVLKASVNLLNTIGH